MINWLRNVFRKKKSTRAHVRHIAAQIDSLYDLMLNEATSKRQKNHPNPLNSFGQKCFSQSDEDGITLEILRRIGKLDTNGVFLELGVADGTENNTLILKALGWKGLWIGGSDLAFNYKNNEHFQYSKNWVTCQNISKLIQNGVQSLGVTQFDVCSLDLDGNDIHFLREILKSNFQPALFIVEYNGRFPPPIQFEIMYKDDHEWDGSDYFGASLMSFSVVFSKYNYKLICCNSHTGANAFFVREDLIHHFKDIPTEISNIYVAPRYHLYNQYAHPISIKTIENLFSKC